MRSGRMEKIFRITAICIFILPFFSLLSLLSVAIPALAASGEIKPVTPQISTPIPNLDLATQIQTTVRNQEQYITIPYLAQYISAFYRYAIGMVLVAAAVMLVYGGFLYILGGTMKSVSRGKDVVVNALIGMVLVFSSFMLLNLVNPQTAVLKPLEIPRVKPDPLNMYMGANQDAPQTLAELGIPPRSDAPTNVAQNAPQTGDPNNPDQVAQEQPVGQATATAEEWVPPPSTARFPTDLTIPKECPGRDPNYLKPTGPPSKDPKAYIFIGGQMLGQKVRNTIAYGGKTLDERVVKKYLEEQSVTGVPAAVIMAQMMTESDAPRCVILNLFDNPAACANTEGAKYYNFGGVGCTQKQVPSDSCAHVAWGPGKGKKTGKMYADSCTDGEGNASIWNRGVSPNCTTICQTQTRNTFNNCGENCYPQKSHSSLRVGDDEVWWPSVQCSKKYKNAHEFLAAHLGFVKFCLPYNDSVYKFAYCVGASTYAGATGSKGPLLAEIIERNCLCGSKDSSKCKRDTKLEDDLVKGIIKKRNLNLFGNTCLEWYDAAKKRCKKYSSDIDYAALTKALQESTSGALNPREYPQNDTAIREN